MAQLGAVLLLGVCVHALAASPEFGRPPNYVINVLPAPEPTPETLANAMTVDRVMAGADGKRYVCHVPVATEPRVGVKEQQTTEKIERCGAAVDALRKCVRLRVDYWTYEVCPGKSFRQFHESEAGSAHVAFVLDALSHAEDRLGTVDDGRVSFVQTMTAATKEPSSRTATVRYECQPSRPVEGLRRTMPAGVSHAIVSVTEEPTLHYSVLVHTTAPKLCRQLASSTKLLAPLNTTCVTMPQGWWTYELCLGRAMRQFHVGQSERAIEAEFSLGRYDWQFGEPVEAATPRRPAAVIQRFLNGDVCDEAGQPRQATVRYQCGTDYRPAIRSVQEYSTCEYEVIVTTSAVCDHPALEPPEEAATAAPPVTINCHPQVALRA